MCKRTSRQGSTAETLSIAFLLIARLQGHWILYKLLEVLLGECTAYAYSVWRPRPSNPKQPHPLSRASAGTANTVAQQRKKSVPVLLCRGEPLLPATTLKINTMEAERTFESDKFEPSLKSSTQIIAGFVITQRCKVFCCGMMHVCSHKKTRRFHKAWRRDPRNRCRLSEVVASNE